MPANPPTCRNVILTQFATPANTHRAAETLLAGSSKHRRHAHIAIPAEIADTANSLSCRNPDPQVVATAANTAELQKPVIADSSKHARAAETPDHPSFARTANPVTCGNPPSRQLARSRTPLSCGDAYACDVAALIDNLYVQLRGFYPILCCVSKPRFSPLSGVTPL
jgi:hypothetical protein